MLKREIKYEDFDGVETSDIVYFNLSKPELIELDVEHGEGFGRVLERIIETKDNKELVKLFKDIILMAYGQKSEDGKRFIKSEKLREEFSQTAAYSSLFMELATDDEAAVKFLTGLLPADMRETVASNLTTAADTTPVT
jgi:hypothetical protein